MNIWLLFCLMYAFDIRKEIQLDFSGIDEYVIPSTLPPVIQGQSTRPVFVCKEYQLALTCFLQLINEFNQEITSAGTDKPSSSQKNIGVHDIIDYLSSFLEYLTKMCRAVGIEKLSLRQDCATTTKKLALTSFLSMLEASREYFKCACPGSAEEAKEVYVDISVFKQKTSTLVFHTLALMKYFQKKFEPCCRVRDDVFE